MPLKTKISTPSTRVLAMQNIRLTSVLSIFVMFLLYYIVVYDYVVIEDGHCRPCRNEEVVGRVVT